MLIFYQELTNSSEKEKYPKMVDNFDKEKYKGKEKIVAFLRHGGLPLFAKAGRNKDVFTGEYIDIDPVGRESGEYQWMSTLSHYVDKYNLRLPEEFENYILKQ